MARATAKPKKAPAGGKNRASAAKRPRIEEIARRLGSMIPEEELRRFPKDLSSQIDHYVYGTPKK
jgi:hypothetical protein